jgi:hypothetical protein
MAHQAHRSYVYGRCSAAVRTTHREDVASVLSSTQVEAVILKLPGVSIGFYCDCCRDGARYPSIPDVARAWPYGHAYGYP